MTTVYKFLENISGANNAEILNIGSVILTLGMVLVTLNFVIGIVSYIFKPKL